MGLEGTLAAFSVTDIFQVLSLQKKTGTLTIESGGDTITIAFLEGRVVSADSTTISLEERIASLLVGSGRLAPEDLQRAREAQKATRQRLDLLLERQNLVSSELLREALRLQIGRIVFAAFRCTKGRFRFRQESVTGLEVLSPPIPGESLLEEAVQILDEWPKIEKKVSSPGVIYSRAPGLENLRLVRSPEEAGEGALLVSRRQTEVWGWVDGTRSVEEILERAFLSDLDTYGALVDLQDRNLIVQSRLQAPPGTPAHGEYWISARAIGLWAVFLLIAALAVREVPGHPWNLSARPPGQAPEAADLLKAVSLGRLASIERALRVYYDFSGQYPKRVEDLLAAGVLNREAITDPYGRTYRYILRSEDGKFSLYGRNARGDIDLDLSFERSLAPVSPSRPAGKARPPDQRPGVQVVQ
jgi:hypothetical protein